MAELLVVGAINTDMIAFVPRAPHAGETVAGGHFEQHGGGKGANQAVSAARSGAQVALLSAVGEDDFGRARLEALERDEIDVSSVDVTPEHASGVAIIIVEESGENRICDLPGAREALTPARCLSAYDRVSPTAMLVTNELPEACLHALFERASAEGVPVWFNIAPFSTTARALLPLVDTLIVNRGEGEDLLDVRGQNASIDQIGAGVIDLGVKRVILTLGSEGVVGLDDAGTYTVQAVPVQPVDTTGAGDTFCGAWAAEMLAGSDFAAALQYANRAAAISVTRAGAQSSIPTRVEVENASNAK